MGLQDLEEGLMRLFQYVYLKVLVSNAECDAL